MCSMISIKKLTKTYAGGFEALKDVSLEIDQGEIFALLGPNGAGKTTLINVVCGIVNASSGEVLIDGSDIVSDYRLTLTSKSGTRLAPLLKINRGNTDGC